MEPQSSYKSRTPELEDGISHKAWHCYHPYFNFHKISNGVKPGLGMRWSGLGMRFSGLGMRLLLTYFSHQHNPQSMTLRLQVKKNSN